LGIDDVYVVNKDHAIAQSNCSEIRMSSFLDNVSPGCC
jgi:hypothetical protein